MRILMVASEAGPFASTGALGSVLASLPHALARRGHEIDVVIPRYRGVAAGDHAARLAITLGGQVVDADFYTVDDGPVRNILVEHPGYYDRDYLYGTSGHDYADNAERFAFLAQAALEWAAHNGQSFDVIHAHDWQAGLVPVLLGRLFRSQAWLTRKPTVFTVHNVAFQGIFDASWLPRLGLPWDLMRIDAMEYWGRISFLKAGIVFSRIITVPSPRLAVEMQTPEGGLGFDGILRSRAADVVGILAGIDYDRWDPARDAELPEPYSVESPGGKAVAKRAVLEAFNLGVDDGSRTALIGVTADFVEANGFDLLAAIADELPRLGAVIAVAGSGERRYEDSWLALASRHPDRIAARVGADDRLRRLVDAGADLALLPMRTEPSGLTAMRYLRYGTVPLVRAAGALVDAVENYDPATGSGTGFTFAEYSPQALLGTLRWALGVFQDERAWKRVQAAGMRQDHSWDAAGRGYEAVYERATAATVWT